MYQGLFLMRLQVEVCEKETLTHVFSFDFCKIFKNIPFINTWWLVFNVENVVSQQGSQENGTQSFIYYKSQFRALPTYNCNQFFIPKQLQKGVTFQTKCFLA